MLTLNNLTKNTENRLSSFEEKGNKEFAIDKEIAFDRVRLRLEYNEEIQDFDNFHKCIFAKCPYGTVAKERILRHFPKHREIRKKQVFYVHNAIHLSQNYTH